MSLTAAAVVLMMGSALPEGGDLPQTDAAPAAQPVAGAPAAGGQVTGGPVSVPLPAFAASPVPLIDPAAAAAEQQAGEPASEQGADNETIGDDILVTRRKPPPPGDPLERINEQSFKAVQAVDSAVVEPVAKAYNKGLPRPIRQGLRNFFTNLGEPVVFVAFLLELKPGKAMETVGRFAINTTLGVGGVMDVAKRKPFHLPYRPNGLANVLGYYGVGPGPYMYLPIIGPTTLRDLIGDSVDNLASPALLGKPFTKPEVALPMIVLNQLGERAAFDDEINKIRKEDRPYAAYRELYLRQRKAEIEALHGRTLPDVVPVYGPRMPTAGGKTAQDPAGQEQAGQPVQPAVPEPAAEPAPAPVPAPVQMISQPVIQPIPQPAA
ncbi:VacJ family lipoprotein [Sphingomonas sp. IC081]|uniref:MlaA family lipoprotein n=1 Tax=Sphingomonas sp. IC081 TaxID=304378 RepID=UPI00115B78D0|nr:VacJ family lipoprotein [Sphingomonas sp. IC081]QDK34786.1 hypothetical protein DM450_18665 [Sphingomonas sp. IC081]